MGVSLLGGDESDESVECRMVYLTSIVMYKPAALSMWMVLMATSHLCFWKRAKAIPPKQQTGILPGTPELPDNYLSAVIVNFTFFMFALWLFVAAYFLPLHFAFFPFSLMLLFGLPLLFMKVSRGHQASS
jgi:hypothetical protein